MSGREGAVNVEKKVFAQEDEHGIVRTAVVVMPSASVNLVDESGKFIARLIVNQTNGGIEVTLGGRAGTSFSATFKPSRF